MRQIQYLLVISLICQLAKAIELELSSQETCMDYVVGSSDTKKMFYFHYNASAANINMQLYHLNTRSIWAETGFGIDYNQTLEIDYDQEGNYTLCFHKQSRRPALVTLEIINEEVMGVFAGKEHLARLSKRMGEAMGDARQVSYRFGQILAQHNERKAFIAVQERYYGYLLVLKTLVMAGVIGVQVLVIKKIFK
jgi:hypothetical protein